MTENYITLSGFLLATNVFLIITMYCFCCGGRNSTKRYDRLFTIYNLLSFMNLINYIWLIIVRFRHSGKVCSGDFASEDVSEDLMSAYYIDGFGMVLKWYFLLETFVTVSCLCCATLWICYTPNAKQRFFTTVEWQNAES